MRKLVRQIAATLTWADEGVRPSTTYSELIFDKN